MAAIAPALGPTLPEVEAYLASAGFEAGDPRLAYAEGALAAEQADQVNRLRFPTDETGSPVYDAALTEALCRRVARNLAVRPLPLGVQPTVTDAGAGLAYIGSTDPEVRRLEAPYRKRVVG